MPLLLLSLTTIVAAGLVRPAPVTVVRPVTMALRDEAVGIGYVKAKRLVGVGAPINGVIVLAHVDQGDRVRAGQVLAELRNTDVQQQLRQARYQFDAQRASAATARANIVAAQARLRASDSALERARAALRLADATLERARRLYADGVVSRDALDAAETAQAVAARDVDNTEALRAASAQEVSAAQSDAAGTARLAEGSAAGVEVRKANLADTVVRSPVDGYVVTRDLEPGATVVPGLPIFTIADAAVVWVSANIDEREIGGVRVGQPATITLRSEPDRRIPGVVARIAQQADPITEEVIVDVAFTGGGADVRLNETAEVEILKRRESAAAVPLTALGRDAEGASVWIVSNGRVARRAVTTGIVDKRGWIGIARGLEPSDLVIANPSVEAASLANGTRVRARHADGR